MDRKFFRLGHQESQRRDSRDDPSVFRPDDLLQLVLANIDDLVAVIDLQGRRVYNSPSYDQILGTWKGFRERIHSMRSSPGRSGTPPKAYFKRRSAQAGTQNRYRFLLPEWELSAISNHRGTDPGRRVASGESLVHSRDVTERKLAEQPPREEQLFRSFFEHSSTSSLSLMPQYGIQTGKPVDPAGARYAPEEVLERALLLFCILKMFSRRALRSSSPQPSRVQSRRGARLQHKLGAWRMFES